MQMEESTYIPSKWDEKESSEQRLYNAERDNIHIPEVISDAWIARNVEAVATNYKLWDKIYDRCKHKRWVFTIAKYFKENIRDNEELYKNFLINLKQYAPNAYKPLINLDYNEEDAKSWLFLNNREKSSSKCLSGLKMSDEDKGKLFVEVSDKSDVSLLVENKRIIAIRDKHFMHNEVVSCLIESVCGVHKIRPMDHNKLKCEGKCEDVRKSKRMSKMEYKGDLKLLPKKFIIDNKFLCSPPPNGGWSKNILLEIIGMNLTGLFDLLSKNIDLTNIKTNAKSIYSILEKHILSKKDFIILQSEESKVEDSKKSQYGGVKEKNALKCDFTLDDWQSEFIEHSKNGKSVLVQGPTSGGKTYASMAVIDDIIKKKHNSDEYIAFVAPNFYLSIQTFAIIANTFKATNLILVTKGIQDIIYMNKPGLKIIVGTPKEMWTLLRSSSQVKLSSLIIDEIHMIGNKDCSIMDKVALSNIMSTCNEQIIGLSATIHEEDLAVLAKYMKDNSDIPAASVVELVNYPDRPVPLNSYTFDFENKVLDKDMKGCNVNIDITPETTIDMLMNLRTNDLTPLLVFDKNDQMCFKHYSNLVTFLDKKEEDSFPCWIEAMNMLDVVHKYNFSSYDTFNTFQLAYATNHVEKIKHMASDIFKKSQEKCYTLEYVVKELESLINRSLACKDNYKETRMATVEENKILRDINKGKIDTRSEVNIDTLQLLPIFKEYRKEYRKLNISSNINSMTPDMVSPIITTPKSVSPFLKMGKTHGAQEIADVINSKEGKKEDQKKRNNMLRMCQAERCKESDVKPLFELLAKGLRFGIGLLIESIPHAIQLKVMSLLKSKSIDIIFASQAMRMGIDYPIRTCVIRTDTLSHVDECALIQMGGRSGRRRKDTEGHVVYVNISNASSLSLSSLPRLSLPKQDKNGGVFITNEKCVINLLSRISNMNRLTNANTNICNILHAMGITLDTGKSKHELEEDEVFSEKEEEINYSVELAKVPENSNRRDQSISEKKDKPTLVSSSKFKQRKLRKRFRKEEIVKDMVHKSSEHVNSFCNLFNAVVDEILDHTIGIDEIDDKKRRIALVKAKLDMKGVKEVFKATLLNEDLPPKYKALEVSIVVKHRLDEWSQIIQEIYMVNRGCKANDFMKTLENIYESLHQSKYKLAII